MKNSTFLVNSGHILCLSLPMFFLVQENPDHTSTFLLSAVLCVFISTVTAFLWVNLQIRHNTLTTSVLLDQAAGLRSAHVACFNGLWLIPKQPLLLVSDALWVISIKKYGQTVKAAMLASSRSDFLLIGIFATLGFYIGFSADFGRVLARITSFTGGKEAARVILVLLSSWVSVAFLFNGGFRFFLARKT